MVLAHVLRMPRRPILLVEDDNDMRELTVALLRGDGFSVESAKNGKEALEWLDRFEEPCLVLLDMFMPVMNGREFMLELLKRKSTVAPIPVYLVSANAEYDESKEMGCLGFLRKPFEPGALLAIVRAHCS
jgi:CheY-like chemotaxis protein